MIHTASLDDFLQNQSIDSYFTSVTRCLTKQTFKEFEFIYIDTFYEDNKDKFQNIIAGLPFVVKHVPVHKNHRYWYDLGHTYISAAKNTGIIYADGELLITCDDSEFFPDGLLERYWNHYQSGHFMIAVHKRMTSIKAENGYPIFPIDGDVYINDHRFTMNRAITHHQNGSWCFAGTSFDIKTALALNGFNEKMDACKSLEDSDFGTRMCLMNKKLVCDLEGFVYILDHQCYSDFPSIAWTTESWNGQVTESTCKIERKKINNFIAIENYGMVRCAIELMELQANRMPVCKKCLAIIQRETIKYRGFDPLASENREKLDIWLKTPNFSLKKERLELRKSSDWKW